MRYLTFNGQMGEKATDLCSPHLARVPMMVKAQKAPYPMDVLLLGARAVMPDSQHSRNTSSKRGAAVPSGCVLSGIGNPNGLQDNDKCKYHV